MDYSILQTAILNDSIRYIHLFSVAVGFGVSFLADASILRSLKHPLSSDLVAGLHWWHKIVSYALIVMWVSGGVLIYMRTGFVWSEFSPKLLAKIIVVSVLTLNAKLISAFALAILSRKVGGALLDMPLNLKLPMALVSGVSTTSWLLALTLGSSVVLKTADASVFLTLIPACYAIGALASLAAVSFFEAKKPSVPADAR